MTAKEYLEQARWLDRAIAANTKEIASIPSKFRENSKYQVLSQKIAEDTIRLIEAKVNIREAVENVRDMRYRTLLQMRYLNCWTWEKIAVEMSFEFSHVTKNLHPAALRAFEAANRRLFKNGENL
jgi:hypothetical protein